MHAVRDSRRDGRGVRGVPRAGVLLSRRPTEWWQSYFDAQYLLEYQPLFSLERDRREVARLIDLLALPVGARILDVPCGQGRHAHLLAEAGFDVRGLDYSRHLLNVARARGTGPTLRYVQGDMRKLPARWSGHFDAVLNLFTSFGFFLDPADDVRVLAEFARVLAPGGTLIWHGGSRDGIMARFLARDWWRADDGTLIAQERSIDPLSGVMTIYSTWRGARTHGEREHRIRLYTASRLAALLAKQGLIVEEAYDGWSSKPLTRRSSEMLLVARKT
ncbi:MAG TPA: methyltransferase domain-containing protein [Gemmatimonadaceae bacterium]|nr:methyltransferase domain-containing protein [Gemmatimonadaceae bacterium]